MTLGHMGELLPFQPARLDSRYKVLTSSRQMRHLPSHYVRNNIHGTTSGVCSHAALLGATHAVGIGRVLVAVDYPFESTVEAIDFLRTAQYAPADLDRIAHGNAERILHL